MIVDTHCHLEGGRYEAGTDAVLARAREAGVGAFVTIGVGDTLEQVRQAVELAEREPDVWASVGLHPHDARVYDATWAEELRRLVASPRVVAFGEIGLDHHYDLSAREVQERVFRELVHTARELELPIVVHTRSAPEETLRVLEEEGAREVGGIIHCFSEDRAFAKRALDLGFDLSFSGIVTFKNAQAIQDVAAWAPIDRVLLETDSPYLAPVPFRGKRCEPAMIVHTARKIAELRGIDVGELEARSTENASRRFGVELARASA